MNHFETGWYVQGNQHSRPSSVRNGFCPSTVRLDSESKSCISMVYPEPCGELKVNWVGNQKGKGTGMNQG